MQPAERACTEAAKVSVVDAVGDRAEGDERWVLRGGVAEWIADRVWVGDGVEESGAQLGGNTEAMYVGVCDFAGEDVVVVGEGAKGEEGSEGEKKDRGVRWD